MVRAITSVAITLPCIWYLWPQSKKSHDHGHGHDDYRSHKDDEESSDSADNAVDTESTEAEEKADKQHETGSVRSDDSDNQEGGQDAPDTLDDESDNTLHEKEDGSEVQDVRFKGPTKDTPPGDIRKDIPDAKEGNKKRIESDYGKSQGVAEGDGATVQEPGNVEDKVCDVLQT